MSKRSALPCSMDSLDKEGCRLLQVILCIGGSQSLTQRRWWLHQTVSGGTGAVELLLEERKVFNFMPVSSGRYFFLNLRNQFPFIP